MACSSPPPNRPRRRRIPPVLRSVPSLAIASVPLLSLSIAAGTAASGGGLAAVSVTIERAPPPPFRRDIGGRGAERKDAVPFPRVLHLACFYNSGRFLPDADDAAADANERVLDEREEDEDSRAGCCDELFRSLRELRVVSVDGGVGADEEGEDLVRPKRGEGPSSSFATSSSIEWNRRCRSTLASVPSPPPDGSEGGAAGGPRAGFCLSIPISDATDGAAPDPVVRGAAASGRRRGRYRRCVRTIGRGGPGRDGASRCDDDGGGGVDSPLHLPSSYRRRGDVVDDDDDGGRDEATAAAGDGDAVLAEVSSFLSEGGGTHRRRRHAVRLTLPGEGDGGRRRPRRIEGNVAVLAPLTEGLYVDADDPLVASRDGRTCRVVARGGGPNGRDDDDALPEQGGNCAAELILPRGTTAIDVERPAFDGRQHAVAFRLTFDLPLPPRDDGRRADVPDDDDDDGKRNPNEEEGVFLELEFESTLHARYPAPVVVRGADRGRNDGTDSGGCVPVYVPPPIVDGGTLVVRGDDVDDEEEDDSGAASYLVRRRTTTTKSSPVLSTDAPDATVLWAAAGRDSDYFLVASVTALSSLAGALVMLRDMSRLCVWR